MKLDLFICLRCRREHGENVDVMAVGELSENSYREFVYCPSGLACADGKRTNARYYTYVDEPPPTWCPYALEHVLLTQEK